jgi:hypothetical protein
MEMSVASTSIEDWAGWISRTTGWARAVPEAARSRAVAVRDHGSLS